MAPKTSVAKEAGSNASSQNPGFSERERQEEVSKTAQSALTAQREAKELREAAASAGVPQERQRLLKEAHEKEVVAESSGKTAKYLGGGAFQGGIAGAGVGTSVGMGLGALTGTLVGGTTSVVTGGLGGAAGLGVGALHGPFVKMGDLTGSIPGLKKMVEEVHEQDPPSSSELVAMSNGGGAEGAGDRSAKRKKPRKLEVRSSEPSKKMQGEENREENHKASVAAG